MPGVGNKLPAICPIVTPYKCQLVHCELQKDPMLHAHHLHGKKYHIGNQKTD